MCKMSESQDLELPSFNGGGDNGGGRGGAGGSGGDIKLFHEETTKSRNGLFCCFFRRVPLKEVLDELYCLCGVACPVALTTFLYFSKTIISMLFLGRMEKAELAGGSLAVGFANITGFSVMKGLCSGMDPICCQAYGARRWAVLSQTYLKTVLLLLLATIPMAALWLNSDSVFNLLGQDPVITGIAKNYLVCSLPELIANANLVPLRTFLRTQGLNSPNTAVATCVALMHVPVTYFMVMYMGLGVKGIAFASVIYSVNMNLGLWTYLFFSKRAIKPWRSGALLQSLLYGWGPLLGLALPSVCQVCLEWWWYEIILFMSGLLENAESCVAAMGILIQTTGTVYVLPFAMSLSISQRVGHALGAVEPARAQLAAMIGVMMAAGYGVAAFGASVALRARWGRLYTAEPQVLEMIAAALPILGLAEVGNAPQTAACGAFTGSARPKVGVWINIAAFYLVGLPCSAVLAFGMGKGFQGLWMGLVAAQAACAAMMLYNLARTDWKHEAKRAEHLTMATEDSAGANLVDGGA